MSYLEPKVAAVWYYHEIPSLLYVVLEPGVGGSVYHPVQDAQSHLVAARTIAPDTIYTLVSPSEFHYVIMMTRS